jgi:hypothetical protein
VADSDGDDVPVVNDTGYAIMHRGALEQSALKLIESCAEQNEPITIPEAVRRTVDQHYPLDADPYEAWGMWIERLQQFGELHYQEPFGDRLDEFGGAERSGYERLQALVRTMAALELQWSLENNPILAEASAKAASDP